MTGTFLARRLLPLVGALTLPGGRRARLSILIYHRVLPSPDPMLVDEIDARTFSIHMDTLAEMFNVLPLTEAAERLRRGTLPSRSACITFDDGYANNATVALPILQERSLPACFFISTGFVNGTCMWNDIVIEALRSSAVPELNLEGAGLGMHRLHDMAGRSAAMRQILPVLKARSPAARSDAIDFILDATKESAATGQMMSPAQIRSLAEAGMEIGGHTVSHPILTTLDNSEARREIAECKEELESIIGSRVTSFAYPNGRPGKDFSSAHVRMVRNLGYSTAVTTARGAARMADDSFLLPRFTPWDRSSARFMLRLCHSALSKARPPES